MGKGSIMAEQTQTPPQVNQTLENKPSDKELNFRMLEAKYEKQLAQERAARQEAEKQTQEALAKKNAPIEEDEDSEPYVDHKRLNRTLSSFEKKMEEKIDRKAEEKARSMIDQNKRDNWLKNNPDFYDVLQHAEKFAQKDPELAESILEMPEGFERQKLVYKTIKSMGLHMPEVKQPSIQDKIDSNRRSPYYQPSGVGTAPYASHSDFSANGQKDAYSKMQELKKRMRLG